MCLKKENLEDNYKEIEGFCDLIKESKSFIVMLASNLKYYYYSASLLYSKVGHSDWKKLRF